MSDNETEPVQWLAAKIKWVGYHRRDIRHIRYRYVKRITGLVTRGRQHWGSTKKPRWQYIISLNWQIGHVEKGLNLLYLNRHRRSFTRSSSRSLQSLKSWMKKSKPLASIEALFIKWVAVIQYRFMYLFSFVKKWISLTLSGLLLINGLVFFTQSSSFIFRWATPLRKEF